MLRKAIGKMQHGFLAKSWETWAFNVQEKKRLEEVIRGMIVRMQRRGMGAAFTTWRDVVEEMNRQRRMMNDAIQRMRRKELKLAWEAWYENTIGLKYDGERKEREAEELADQRRMRVLARFLRRDLVMAFQNWCEVVSDIKEMRHKLAGCVRRMTMRGLAGAFNTWAEAWEEAVELRRKMQRAVQKMMNVKMAGAFGKWASATREAALERAREAHRLAGAAGRASALSPSLHIVRRRVCDAMTRLEDIWAGSFLSKERKAKLAELQERVDRLNALIPTLSELERAPYIALAGKERAARLADAGGDQVSKEAAEEEPAVPLPEEMEASLSSAAAEIEAELIALAEAHSRAVQENMEARAAVAAAAADERKRQRALVGMIRRRIVTHLNETNDSMRSKLTVLSRHMDNGKWVMAAAMEEMDKLDAEEAVDSVRRDDLELADAPDAVVTAPPPEFEGDLVVKGLHPPRHSKVLEAATTDFAATRAAHPMPRMTGWAAGWSSEQNLQQPQHQQQGRRQGSARRPVSVPGFGQEENDNNYNNNDIVISRRPATANPAIGAAAPRRFSTVGLYKLNAFDGP
jgi:hypothetical protein